jgi:hypothetical protein
MGNKKMIAVHYVKSSDLKLSDKELRAHLKEKFNCSHYLTKTIVEMSKEEFDQTRLKAYLSFDEESIVGEPVSYLNSQGKTVQAKIVYVREDEIIVENENGCRVALKEEDLL